MFMFFTQPLSNCFILVCNNCIVQNKNNTVLRLANLIKRGFLSSITITFLITRHTKKSYYRNFNTMKIIYYNENMFIKDEALKILGKSEYIIIINTTADLFTNLRTLQDSICYKYSDRTISKVYLLIINSKSLISVSIISSITLDKKVICDLKLASKRK